jgi:two-component system, NtrC family, sensor histidine kinase HydH
MSIKVLIQATAEGRREDFKYQDLQVLEEEIIRLEQIVSGFLDFARPPKPEPRPIDMKDFLERTIEGVRARAELQGVRLQMETGPGPMVISADPHQLKQVIFNLLFNALDAQPQGGHITIRVGIDPTNPNHPALLVVVEDGGPGIPKELGERIFDPFVSTKETGIGLGLSICRRIVESHGGSLKVTSSDRGTTFTLRLPVVRPSASFALTHLVT